MGLTINNFRGESEWSCTTPATPDCTARSGDAILTRHVLSLALVAYAHYVRSPCVMLVSWRTSYIVC